ncbi:glucose 1-dehydrogenase [Nocardioides sp. CCNWLW239]|uniref:glucose 1-dehydrogenase n=1 Tax=Nocardioides sp. CCNWLW239 TaxID=3128902 RepID=UPI00301AA6F1
MGTLDDKVVIITGGARGMGAAHARHFVAEGARVVIGDLLDEDGKALADELGERAVFAHLDVTSPQDWDAVVALATATYGRLDGLVNNAGVLAFRPIADTDVEEFRRILDINLTGAWLGIKAVTDVLARQGGSVVNVSSINGFVGSSGLSAYTASKFAVRGLTKAAAQELGAQGIRVNSIHPGGIATPMTGRSPGQSDTDGAEAFARVPIPRWGRPEEVSPLAAYLVSDLSSYCTGSEFVVDGGALSGTIF